MNNTYNIFGLNITSDIFLPASPVLFTRPDIVIKYGNTPDALTNPQFKGVRFQAGQEEFLLRVDGVARYYVQDGSRITIMSEAGASDDDVRVFLMGSAMGALLHQRNVLALHASAIVVNGESVVFVGPSGVGKSTLAAGYLKRGYSFLADDLCAITMADGRAAVIPGFPSVKLWADVLEKLDFDKDTLKNIRWGKELKKYSLPVETMQYTPFPIKSIFIIKTTNTDRMEVTSLKGGDKVESLIENTYRFHFLNGLGGKKDHFRQCVAVAAKADVYRTFRPKKGYLLDELMDMMEARFGA